MHNEQIPKQADKYEKKVEVVSEGGGEKGPEVQNKSFFVNGCELNAKVSVDPNNNISFAEDIDMGGDVPNFLSSFMDEFDLRVLFDAGILKKGNPASCKSKYGLGGDGYSGYILINKDEINDAVKSGKLKIRLDEDGNIEVL